MNDVTDELEKQIKDLEKEKEKLEKQKLLCLVDEGKAYKCKKCQTIEKHEYASQAMKETQLCHNCLNRMRKEERKQKTLQKLKYARIVDIEIDRNWVEAITKLTVYKQGKMYELNAREDEGEAYFRIDKEWEEDQELPIDKEEKPWDKPRVEKPLIAK